MNCKICGKEMKSFCCYNQSQTCSPACAQILSEQERKLPIIYKGDEILENSTKSTNKLNFDCPVCGSKEKAPLPDMSRSWSHFGPFIFILPTNILFSTKYKCGKCGYLWLVPGSIFSLLIVVCISVYALSLFMRFIGQSASLDHPNYVVLGFFLWPIILVVSIISSADTAAQLHLKIDSAQSISNTQIRPWVRFWARIIDCFLFCTLVGSILLFIPSALGFLIYLEIVCVSWVKEILPPSWGSTLIITLSIDILGFLFAFFVYKFLEAFILSGGTTPGKALLKVKLCQEDGTELNYSNALSRSLRVGWRGEGLCLPIVSLIPNIFAYFSLMRTGKTSWDRDGKLIVSHQTIGAFRIFVIPVVAVSILLSILPFDEKQLKMLKLEPPQFLVKIIQHNYLDIFKWYRKAAEQGHAEAQCILGDCYQQGIGVKKDPVEAVKWYRKAADQGNADAQYELYVCYFNGDSVEEFAEGYKWLRKAASQGLAEAKAVLEKGDISLTQVRKSAEQGDAKAQYELGTFYECGIIVVKDQAEAVKWYRKAAEQGDADAKRNLKSLSN